MISAFVNIWKVPELKKRVLFTLGIILLIRVGSTIPIPGIDSGLLQEVTSRAGHKANDLMQMVMLLSGGAMSQAAIFSLGIMPYITASIIMQMMMAVVPALKRMIQEGGESGRQQFIQYTRYLTLAICVGQSFLLARTIAYAPDQIFGGNPSDWVGLLVLDNTWGFIGIAVATMTCGTMFIMWLGEQITERGVGNGASVIIAVGIIDRIPSVSIQAFQLFFGTGELEERKNPMVLIPLVALLLLAIAFVVMLTQGVRKIPVQYAKRMVGQKLYGGGATFMPLKVNYSGVMPIIFGQALLLFPFQILKMVPWTPLQKVATIMTPGSVTYEVSFALLILFFAYFWVNTQFDPVQISDDLKKHGGYIPGIRPGQATSDFLDFTMTRITFAGAIALVILAIVPELLGTTMGVPRAVASFFGGTSLLIMVGVMLDVMRQIESHLLMRHYDGFLKKGKIRGRR